MALCIAVLRGADPPVGAPPLARFTRENRRRLLAVAPLEERWLRRFAASAEGYLYKEVLRHGNPNNLVHVLMVRRSLPFELAVHRIVALINGYTRQLVELEGEVLEAALPAAVGRYVAGMRQLLRGNYDWSLATARYRSERSPFPELRPLPRGQPARRGQLVRGA